MEFEIYTDGACFPNPGKGGWAFLSRCGIGASGHEEVSTNQRMEMLAVIRALKTFDGQGKIKIVTDSRFVIDGSTKWMPNWKKNDWRKKSKGPIKNLELWMELDALLARNEVRFQWVKGHSGDPMNERADAMAGDAIGLSAAERQKWERRYQTMSRYV